MSSDDEEEEKALTLTSPEFPNMFASPLIQFEEMSADYEGEEKELSLTSPEVVTKYKRAGKIVNEALQVVLAECKPKAKIVDICEKGDAFIKEQTARIYKKLERGVAFPTCISVNNTVGHFSPLASDETVLEEGDMVKIDMGCHIDGFIALVGHTHVLQEGPVSGRKADVISAANTAAEVALRLVRPGKKNTDVTEAIQKVAAAYDCKIVEGVLSHQMKQHVIDGNKVVLSVASPEATVEEVEFEENEVYAIDIVASTGDGKPNLIDEKQTTIYKKGETFNSQLKMKASRFIISEIKQNFPHMPFTARSLEDKEPCLGLAECVNCGHLKPYHVRYEKPGDFVAQIKFTVLLMASGSDRITSCTLQGLQPTKTIEDPEIKGWLALSIKKKEAEHSRVKDTGVPSSADSQVVIRLWPSSKRMTVGCVDSGIESYHIEARYSPQDPGDFHITLEKGFSAIDAAYLSSLLKDQDDFECPRMISKMIEASRKVLASLDKGSVGSSHPQGSVGSSHPQGSVGSSHPRGSPQFFNQFEELDCIGEGGFAHVSCCRHKLDLKLYAVKKIRFETEETTDLKILREVTLLSLMNSPFIVRYYYSWSEKGFINSVSTKSSPEDGISFRPTEDQPKVPDHEAFCLYIQMEYCPGTLRKFLNSRRTLDESFAWRAFQQILQGLDHIHKHDVVHRDINPNNIVMDFEDNMKIADFGLAKSLSSEDSATSGNSGIPGTAIYMAPEVAAKVKTITTKVDIYSLGIVFLELWYPFKSLHERTVTCTQLKEKRVLPSDFSAAFPTQASLVLRMTSKTPSDRPSAEDLLEEVLGL